jgi:hypothetical protein
VSQTISSEPTRTSPPTFTDSIANISCSEDLLNDTVAWIYYVYINIVATSIHVHLLLMQQRATLYITVQ